MPSSSPCRHGPSVHRLLDDRAGSKTRNRPSEKNRSQRDLPYCYVPKEQMSHVQVVTVQPTDFPRVLRLNGAVAFNGFLTTPVITQVGGPG